MQPDPPRSAHRHRIYFHAPNLSAASRRAKWLGRWAPLKLSGRLLKGGATDVDARAIGQLRKRRLELEESNLPPEQRQMATASVVMEAVRALLSSSPELELTHVNVPSQNGNLTAKAKIGVDGKYLSSFADPMFLKRAVEGSAELRVPARIAHWVLDAALSSKLPAARQGADKEVGSAMRQVQRATLRTQVLQHLTTANVLTREGDVFGLHLVYRDAELVLNGQPFDRRALSGFALTTGSSL